MKRKIGTDREENLSKDSCDGQPVGIKQIDTCSNLAHCSKRGNAEDTERYDDFIQDK